MNKKHFFIFFIIAFSYKNLITIALSSYSNNSNPNSQNQSDIKKIENLVQQIASMVKNNNSKIDLLVKGLKNTNSTNSSFTYQQPKSTPTTFQTASTVVGKLNALGQSSSPTLRRTSSAPTLRRTSSAPTGLTGKK